MAISEIQGSGPALILDLGHGAAAPARVRLEHAPFERALGGVAHAVERGEALMARATAPRDYDAATLIALQAGIYRYSEAVELVSKIVDHAGAAARTVLQSGNH